MVNQVTAPLPAGVAPVVGGNICTSCGNFKNRGTGTIRGVCPRCDTYWCLKDNCAKEYGSSQALKRHLTKKHLQPNPPNRCCHCGGIKNRGAWLLAQCPQCYAYWCNYGNNCPEEQEENETALIKRHMKERHNINIQ